MKTADQVRADLDCFAWALAECRLFGDCEGARKYVDLFRGACVAAEEAEMVEQLHIGAAVEVILARALRNAP